MYFIEGFLSSYSNLPPTHTPSEKILGTSLVVQWLRICLLMQETWIWSLIEELRLRMPRGDKAHAPQLLSLCSRAHATVKIPHAAAKTQHSQRNEYILKKQKSSQFKKFIAPGNFAGPSPPNQVRFRTIHLPGTCFSFLLISFWNYLHFCDCMVSV